MESTRRSIRETLSVSAGFTLVELLVVITIIGILASLITVAASGALKRAHQAQIKTELDQLTSAFQTYRDTYASYPPNCQNDGGGTAAATPVDENQAFTDLKRHFKQAFPRSRESDDLLLLLAGQNAVTSSADYPSSLKGGMTAGEAIVFWLGGFSADPKYPISGDGGPAYDITANSFGSTQNRTLDPLSRKWIYPFTTTRLQPRKDDNYFNEANNRFIEYLSPITVNGVRQRRRINFWQYVPAKSEQPYLYFDTSRHTADAAFDPPAATALTGLGPGGNGLPVYAIKKLSDSSSSTLPIQFANADKFQILHAGIDDEWGDFSKMNAATVQAGGGDPTKAASYLLFPTGPFTGEVADTIVNFSEATLSASQK